MKTTPRNAVFQEFALAPFLRAVVILIAITSPTLLSSGLFVNSASADEREELYCGWDESFLDSCRENLLNEFNEFERTNGFGRSFKVKASERFIFVYDTSDAYLEWLRALTAEVARAFDRFCEQMDFEIEPPAEPLTVVVFATREEFDAYAAFLRGPEYLEQENKPIGFFNHGNNRSVVFDLTDTEASRVASNDEESRDDREFSRRKINGQGDIHLSITTFNKHP